MFLGTPKSEATFLWGVLFSSSLRSFYTWFLKLYLSFGILLQVIRHV